MTTEARADQLVVGCLAAAGAIAGAGAIATGSPPPIRQVAGFAVVAVGLAAGAMFAPGLAGGFAILILTSSVFVYGQPLWETVSSVTSSTPTPSKGHNP